MAERRNRRLPPYICLVIGVGLAAAGWVLGSKYREYTAWPTVEGQVVLSAEVAPAAGGEEPKLGIKYEYQVNGDEYSGRRVSRGLSASSTVEKNPVGKTVRVHVSPNNPEEAFMDAAGYSGWVYTFNGSIVLILFALIWLVAARPRVSAV